MMKSVISQFWMISTPSRLAARAYPRRLRHAAPFRPCPARHAEDGETRIGREIVDRRHAVHVLGEKKLRVDAVYLHGVDGARADFHFGGRVAHIDHAPLR